MSLYIPEAEQAVIGCTLALEDARDALLERLQPHHFGEPAHGRIWAAIQGERRKGPAFDLVAVHAALASDEGYLKLGGHSFLLDMVDSATAWSVEANADIVLERAARRAVAQLASDVGRAALDTSQGTAEGILADMEREAAAIAKEGVSRPLAIPVGLTALDTMEAAWRGEYVGTSVGLECLDRVTGGIRRDDVWFIGGRTSMGKSVCALSLARGIAEQGRGVMMFSLEMPLREVQARLVSDISYDVRIPYNGEEGGNVRYGDLLKGRGNAQQKERARAAARQLASLPLSVTDVGGLTIDDIRMQAQRQMRAWEKAGVERGAILIDHIGLVKPHRKSDSKAAETADTVNELKALAKYLGAPVIALCQVNRNTESRNDKRPTLADLNWSGAIEQIADMICLLYRESYYLQRSSDEGDQADAIRKQYELELLIHKNRSGPICTVEAFVDVACNVVRDKDDPMRRRA